MLMLHFLENELFKEEINIENTRKYDVVFSEVLDAYGLPNPHEGNIQYACIFTSFDNFNQFYHAFEDQITMHKLWLDTKVRTHLVFMQLYFDIFNTIPLMVKRIPLPKGKELTDELKRPRKSMMRDNMYNVDMKKCLKRNYFNYRPVMAAIEIF